MLWRVDVYGNVLYRSADAGTKLSWKLDYHFPVERGGLSKPGNMRIIQFDAYINKADKYAVFRYSTADLSDGLCDNMLVPLIDDIKLPVPPLPTYEQIIHVCRS